MQDTKFAWMTTDLGGQFGVHPLNIRYLKDDHLVTKDGTKVGLSPGHFEENKRELIKAVLPSNE